MARPTVCFALLLLAIFIAPLLYAQTQPPPLLNLNPNSIPAVNGQDPTAGWRPRQAPLPAATPGSGDKESGWRPRNHSPPSPARSVIQPARSAPTLELPAEPETIPTLPQPLPVRSKPKTPDARATLLLSAARNAVARGVPSEAVPRFEEYLQLYPNDLEVKREYAGLLVQVDRVKDAIEQFKALLVADRDNTAILIPLADAYLQLKDFRKATGYLTQALERAPNNLEYAVKLARSLAFEGDLTKALQIFDRHLGKRSPTDARVPKSYGALLVDLGKADDAIEFLTLLRERFPDDLEVISFLIRAYARLGNRVKALELISDMAERKPGTIPVRLELAEALYQSSELDLAAQVYTQVLQAEATNALAQIGLARVNIQSYHPAEACRILHGVTPTGSAQRIFLLTWAEYHQVVGEYTQAKQIYKSFLEKDDSDNEVRLALARLYEFIREDEKAKAEYAKIPNDAAQYRAARVGIISVLLTQRRFAEAIELGRNAVREAPNDSASRAILAKVLAKSGACIEAEIVCREYLKQETRNESGILDIRLALGKILLDEGKLPEAAAEFEAVLARPAGRVAPAYYGLIRVRMKLGPAENTSFLYDAASTQLGEPRARLQLADLFVADVDDATAGELCQAALRADGDNLAILIRLADIRQRQASASGDVAEAVALCESILKQSPHNVRALQALARAWSIAQKFAKSVETYDQLITFDPDFIVPRRERARVLYSDHAYGSAQAAYADLPKLPVQEILKVDPAVGNAANRVPALDPFTKPRVPFDVLHGNIVQTNAVTVDTDVRSASQRVQYDLNARATNAQDMSLESQAKALKGWRNYASIPIYKQLLAIEPANTEALFDLGQVYGALRQTRNEIKTYGDLLTVDPRHRDGAIAMDRASMEISPQLWLNQDFFSQRGRDGTAAIDRYKYTAAARLPCGDENEFVQFGFSRVNYDPVAYEAVDGNILSARAQKKVTQRLLLYGQANLEMYEPGAFDDRVTFETGAFYEPCDFARLFFNGFLENVAESSGSLAQDIYRGGIRFGSDMRATRRWAFGGNYMFAAYSDHNSLNQFSFYNEVLLTYLPKQLKFVSRLDFQGFANQTVFFPPNPSDIVNTVHPYFAPQAFSYFENRIEWLQYIGRDYFTHANVCYYSLQYGLGYDNNFYEYHRFRALFNYDMCSWASVGVDSNALFSKLYRSVGASAYLVLRLPHFHR